MLDALAHISHRLSLTEPTNTDTQTEDQLLTTKEVGKVISMTPASIDTYCSDGRLVEGVHFYRKGRRRLFSKKAMWAWATNAEQGVDNTEEETVTPFPNARRRQS